MKARLLLLLLLPLLQACSWIERFFIVNDSSEEIVVEMKLSRDARGFPIFNYKNFWVFPEKKGRVDHSGASESLPHDTLEDYAHIRFRLPSHKAVAIGQLYNDHYKSHDQYFINDRKFNLEQISFDRAGGKIVIGPGDFDRYFHKSNGEVLCALK